MASLEQRNGRYRIVFRYGGQKFHRSLKTKDSDEAETIAAQVERKLGLLEEGHISLPEGADFLTWLTTDGRQEQKPLVHKKKTVRTVFAEYEESLPNGAMEENSLYTARIHVKHFGDILGDTDLRRIDQPTLQRYIIERGKKKTRKGTVTATTIRKELTTLGSLWSFAVAKGYVDRPFPSKGLKYPKVSEKPPFRTWEEIEQNVRQGADEELWESLFLRTGEIAELLTFLVKNARHEMIPPMVAVAAYTGARRSELLRSRLSDFEGEMVTIREKKRSRGKYTTRSVPAPGPLQPILSAWIAAHPGGELMFPLTIDKSNHQLRGCLTGRWEKVRGWHIFRHSFISNCAAAGVDQRIIDAWSGHQTDEMRKRYTHLFPEKQRSAIDTVFQ